MSRWLSIRPGHVTGVVLWDDRTPVLSGTFRPYPSERWTPSGGPNDRYAWRTDVGPERSVQTSLYDAWRPFLVSSPVAAYVSEWSPTGGRAGDERLSRDVARYWAIQTEILGTVLAAITPLVGRRVPYRVWLKSIHPQTGLKAPSSGTPAERAFFLKAAGEMAPDLKTASWDAAAAACLGAWALLTGFAPPRS